VRAILRIRKTMLRDIRADLMRAHPFAYERVGFIACNVMSADNYNLTAKNYYPISEDGYEETMEVGALINAEAIRDAMQVAFDSEVAMLHVHLHETHGVPSFSRIDMVSGRELIPCFWNVRSNMPHGMLLLSNDDHFGLLWLPDRKSIVRLIVKVN
jgi:hypothetical protein